MVVMHKSFIIVLPILILALTCHQTSKGYRRRITWGRGLFSAVHFTASLTHSHADSDCRQRRRRGSGRVVGVSTCCHATTGMHQCRRGGPNGKHTSSRHHTAGDGIRVAQLIEAPICILRSVGSLFTYWWGFLLSMGL